MKTTLYIIILSFLMINICIANTNTNNVISIKIQEDLKKTAENTTHIIAGKILEGKLGKIFNMFIGGNWIGDLMNGRFNSKNIQIPIISDTPSSIEINCKNRVIK